MLGFDREWTYQPPAEYLTSWEADRSLTPAMPITLGNFFELASRKTTNLRGNVLNTIIVAAINVPAVLITSVLAAYAFARIDFFGKNVLFILLLSTMMIPFEAMLIPNYIIVAGVLRWHDTFKALTVPFMVSVFNIFLLRQFFMSIPKDYYDAARLDGAGTWLPAPRRAPHVPVAIGSGHPVYFSGRVELVPVAPHPVRHE